MYLSIVTVYKKVYYDFLYNLIKPLSYLFNVMNGLSAKISLSGANKPKNKIIGAPIDIRGLPQNIADGNYASVKRFLNAASVDEQLSIIKNVLEEQKVSNDNKLIEFLAIVFYEAPAKHPIKCFLARHITKCSCIQAPFTECLSSHILTQTGENKHPYSDYEYYADVVPKLVLCLENFPAGTAAIESIDAKILIKYLFLNYFKRCRKNIRNSPSLPITKKNEVFSFEHLMLRLLVHIIQKLNLKQDYKTSEWTEIFHSIICCIEELITDEEVPMDTKSLSGILFLSVETLKWKDAWKDLLESTGDHSSFHILRHKTGRLAVYSAIATTVPMEKLQEQTDDGTAPAILILLDRLLSFADGSGLEPAQTLCVARSLVHLSKSLGALGRGLRPEVGARAADSLLEFVWPHLEFHLDSVRHLAQLILNNVLEYCAELEKGIHGGAGDPGPLARLVAGLRSRGRRRSLYWTAARAARALGAGRALGLLVSSAAELMDAAADPHLHAAVCAAISALIAASAGSSEDVFQTWVPPALHRPAARAAVLAALAPRPRVLALISERVRGAALLACCGAAPRWRALLPHDTLRAATVHCDEETRLLAFSLVCTSERSTQAASRAELSLALSFLRYNINSPQPAFRHAVLDYFKKLLKRVEDSYKRLPRDAAGAHYVQFVVAARRLCCGAARRGASPGRRGAALQLLASITAVHLPPYQWTWKEEEVEILLQLLDDSYDTNKELALQVLHHCPEHMLTGPRLELRDVVRAARSRRPADSAAAAYKLRLVVSRATSRVVAGNERHATNYTGDPAWLAHYVLLSVLLEELEGEIGGWGGYGLLHCIAALLKTDMRSAPWHEGAWGALAQACVAACAAAQAHVLPVVAHAAPEGYLPEELRGNTSLEDGKTITSQMVLVCAWRTIKESSFVMGAVAPVPVGGRRDEGGARAAGRALARVLARAAHRGALDQAAVGLQILAGRCWCSESGARLVRGWTRATLARAAAVTQVTRRGAGLPVALQALVTSELAATGRAECFHECMAFLLRQATSPDPLTDGAPNADAPSDCAPNYAACCNRECNNLSDRGTNSALSDDILSDDDCSDASEVSGDDAPDDDAPDDGALSDSAAVGAARRALAANILRALYRHAALEGAARAHVQAGLCVAVCGFDAAAWTERTAMSLLFASLAVRTFGAARARGALDPRNRMSGRLFFQRYPGLYPLMLSKLKEARESPGGVAGGALYPVLLVLARLYPSALEGAVSNMKVSAFVPLVEECARSRAMHARRLAADALRRLLPPTEFFSHIERMFGVVSDREIERNHCHGVLLQVGRLLETPPEAPAPPDAPAPALPATAWLLAQAVGSRPCYVIAREYTRVINLLVWKFPKLISEATISAITDYLRELLFTDRVPPITMGRELCLADSLYLYLILLHRGRHLSTITELILKTLQHNCYDVVLATLNYILILHQEVDDEDCHYQKHLNSICDRKVLEILRENPEYIPILTKGYNGKYLECKRKCLRLLTLENDTQLAIINETIPSDCVNLNRWVIERLIQCTESAHGNLTHLYLESLLKFTSGKLADSSLDMGCVLDVVAMVNARSSPDNSDSSRSVIVAFLEKNLEAIMKLDSNELEDTEKFRYKATVLATLVALLEDDDDGIRQRAADVVVKLAAPVILGDIRNENVTARDVKTEGVISEDVTARYVRNEDVTARHGKTEDVTARNVKTEDVISEDVTARDVKTEDVISEDVAATDVKTEDVISEDVTARDVKTEDVISEDVTARDVKTEDVISEDVTATDVKTEDVISEDVTARDVKTEDVISEDVTARDVKTEDVISEDVTATDVKTEDVISEDVAATDVKTEDVISEDVTARDVKTEDVISEDVTARDVKTEDVISEDVTARDVKTEDVISEDVTARDVKTEDVISEDVTATDVKTEDVISEDVTARDVKTEDVISGDVTTRDVKTEDSTPENVSFGDGKFDKDTLARVIVENNGEGIIASVCGELLRDYIESLEDSAPLLVLVALMDFRCEVCMTDELSEECRVFDQSERYNIFLEETVWTEACAEKIIRINKQKDANLIEYVLTILHDTKYVQTFEILCQDNYSLFVQMAKGDVVKDEITNPKIELFLQKLREL